jgi:hypothetical protein
MKNARPPQDEAAPEEPAGFRKTPKGSIVAQSCAR